MGLSFWQYRPRYVKNAGSERQPLPKEVPAIEMAEAAAYEAIVNSGDDREKRSSTLVRGLRGIVEHVEETPAGWKVHDIMTNESYVVPFDKHECSRASMKRGGVLPRDNSKNPPKDWEARMHYLRAEVKFESKALRNVVQEKMQGIRLILARVERELAKDKNPLLNDLGELQSLGTAFDIAISRYMSAMDDLRKIDTVIDGNNPHHYR